MSLPFRQPQEKGRARKKDLVAVVNRLGNLRTSGDYSDFVVECAGRSFKLHKAIVCPQSGFFRRLCDPKFKEGSEGRATLQETDPDLLDQAISFLYTTCYSDSFTDTNLFSEPLSKREKSTAEREKSSTITSPSPASTNEVVLVEDDNDEEEDEGEGEGEDGAHIYTEEVVEIGISPTTGKSEFALQEDHPTLMVNVRMYILADYLEIPLLKKEALRRCSEILKVDFEPARLIGPLQVALENTNSSDTELRTTMLCICSDNREKVVGCTKLDELLSREEPIAWKVLKSQDEKHVRDMHEHDKIHDRMIADVNSLEVQIVHLKHELETTEKLVQRREDRLDECVKLTQRWTDCRNCDARFEAELERHRNTGEYFLRCNRCRCRHEEY